MQRINIEQAKAYLEKELNKFGYALSIQDYDTKILIYGPNINNLGLTLSEKIWNRKDGVEFVVRQVKQQLVSDSF